MIDTIYDEIGADSPNGGNNNPELFHDGLVPVGIDGQGFGYIDKNGNAVTEFKYKEACLFCYGRAAVCEEDEWGELTWHFIDNQGNTVSESYDKVTNFDGKIAAVYKDNKWGLIDQDGKVVLELDYEFMDNLLIDSKYRGFVFRHDGANEFYVISK